MKNVLRVLLCGIFIGSVAHAKPHYPTPWVKKLCERGDNRIICLPYVGSKSIGWFEFAESNELYARGLMKLNRRDTTIWKNHMVAVAWPLKQLEDELSFSPFPDKSPKWIPNKTVVVDLNNLAWGAYDEIGNLVRWSVANGGSKKCTDTGLMKCKTPVGEFTIIRKGNDKTRSNLYPLDCKNKKICGYKMPYFVQFAPDGSGLHGAKSLPGKNVSHSCVRVLKEDAYFLWKWTDKNTKIIVMDY